MVDANWMRLIEARIEQAEARVEHHSKLINWGIGGGGVIMFLIGLFSHQFAALVLPIH